MIGELSRSGADIKPALFASAMARRYCLAVAFPLLLIALAVSAAAMLAYGTSPNWSQFEQGLRVIVWSRRLQWPLVTLSLLFCVVLIGLVVVGQRRAWWLIGLGPVLALFVHRFGADNPLAPCVADNPPLLAVSVPRDATQACATRNSR